MTKAEKKELSNLVISATSTVRAALSAIDDAGVTTVFVIRDDGTLAGQVSERGICRSLLLGKGLDCSVVDVIEKPRAIARNEDGRAAVLDLMQSLKLREVPVVDAGNRILAVHTQDEIVGAPERKNWAVVMAGGLGTRLAPLTKDIPKPMLPIAGRPILERIVLHLVGSGIRKIFLSVNYLADIIEKHFGDGTDLGCEIEYLRESPDRPLGTGGALRLLADLGYEATEPLLVMNGDLVTDFSVQGLFDAHHRRSAEATIAVSEYEHRVPFGVLEATDERLVRIVEKPTCSWAVNAGIYVLNPPLLSRIPDVELFPITKIFENCLQRDEIVGLWPITQGWQDIGRPAELAQARGQR